MIIGVGDFNDDGQTDLLWHRASTGAHYVTLMNGPTKGAYSYLGGNGDGLSIIAQELLHDGEQWVTLMDTSLGSSHSG